MNQLRTLSNDALVALQELEIMLIDDFYPIDDYDKEKLKELLNYIMKFGGPRSKIRRLVTSVDCMQHCRCCGQQCSGFHYNGLHGVAPDDHWK